MILQFNEIPMFLYKFYHNIMMKCRFCNKPVNEEYESLAGCKDCVEDWKKKMVIDYED